MSGRHFLPLTEDERREMLAAMGAAAVEDLYADIPPDVLYNGELKLPPSLSEGEALRHLVTLAGQNKNSRDCISFLGGGIYDHFIPSIVKHVTGRSEFYTSYTPYQPEVSQGFLQAIFEYQTMICRLTGMDVANASLYDGATALVEGAVMACGDTRRSRVLVSASLSPFYRRVLRTYLESRGIALDEVPLQEGRMDREKLKSSFTGDTAALLIQQPNFFGLLEDMEGVADLTHSRGALLVAAVDPLSLPLVQTPGEFGADIVAGEGQALGSPTSFGGPLLGFFAARKKLIRRMPGRIVGETVDREGNRGFVLTLQTREQHIRRERATSNICSNQALNALAAAVHMAALGPQGMREAAFLCLQKSAYARAKLTSLPGYELAFPGPYFKEFPLRVPGDPAGLNKELLKHNILGGLSLAPYYPEMAGAVLFCVTENRSREDIDSLARVAEGWK